MTKFHLPTLTVRGSREEMGHGQGETFRETIQRFIEMRFAAAVTYFGDAGRGTVAELLEVGRASYTQFLHWSPDDAAEHNALAAAANVAPDTLYAAANYTDMRDAVILAGDADAEGCSSVLLPKPKTENGQIIAGQTWDLNPQDIDYVVAVHRVPQEGLETWAITVAGCPTLVGMNETGLMVGTTNIKTWGARPGIGYMSILHRMLQAETASAAGSVVEGTARAGAHTYWIASADSIREYEATPASTHLRASDSDSIIRTNHTLHAPNRSIEWQPPSSSSLARHARLTECTTNQSHDMESLKQAFANRQDGFDSVNRYEEDGQGTATNAVLIGEPASQTLWACRGPADRGEWVTLAFERPRP